MPEPSLDAANYNEASPMVMVLILTPDGKPPSMARRTYHGWSALCRAAYPVMCKLAPKSAEADIGFMTPFRDATYRPSKLWHAYAGGDFTLILLPEAWADHHRAAVEVGEAVPICGVF